MTHSNGFVPRADGEFIAWARTIYNDCSQHASEWVIPPDIIAQLSILVDTASLAFDVNSDKERRNKASVSAKNAAIVNLRRFLSAFVNTLEGNQSIPDEAITSMGLRPRHPHAHLPIPVPTDAPVITAIVGQHHDITVYASTLQHGHPTEYLKDGKYAGFLLQYKIESETQWQSVISTKLHYTLIFTEAEEGKYILMQGAWVNPRMQNGPWSEQVRELVN
ncbi:MAG: hypothetical protein LBB88_11290 [Planctomycetaceae bacterium]|jgi:hypothetical protein|nr:hypothetical protein [Planctomycetaceae bacterium]